MARQSRPVRLTIYNHKGGVGKTTLSVNIAAALVELDKSVLLVDSDPQCNLTSYLLPDDVVDEMLNKSDGAEGSTIWTAVRPYINQINDGVKIEPQKVGGLRLVPGDIRMSEYEEFLGDAWTDSFKRRLGGFRALTSISNLVAELTSKRPYDYVFYDTGPNIGPLNRVLLMDSDYFIVPVACDLFSVRALSTLGQTLKKWIVDARTIRSLAPDGTQLLAASPKFLGYIPQRFKVYGQVMAQEPAHYLRQIRRQMFKSVSAVLREVDLDLAQEPAVDPVIGQVQDYVSLIQAAQREGVPLWECSSTNVLLKQKAHDAFLGIAKHIIANTKT